MIDPRIDRVGVIGASDTKYLMMGLNTKGFRDWWFVKCGEAEDTFEHNKYTLAGSMLESHILDAYGKPLERDERIVVNNHLAINLDGYEPKGGTVVECKTSSYENVFWGSVYSEKNYIMQVRVQMHYKKADNGIILYYGLLPEEYKPENLITPSIDVGRMKEVPVEQDLDWINNKYLPRVELACECLDSGDYPWERI